MMNISRLVSKTKRAAVSWKGAAALVIAASFAVFPAVGFAYNPSSVTACPSDAVVIVSGGMERCVFNADLSNVPNGTRYQANAVTMEKLCQLSNERATYYSHRELSFDSPGDNYIVGWNAISNILERFGARRFNHGVTNLLCSMPVGATTTQYQPLSVSCSADRSAINAGDRVRWTASVTGGVPSSYRFSWTGTDNNPAQTGASNFINYAYYQGGAKQVSVTVTSDGVSPVTHSCSTVVSINENQNAPSNAPLLNATCYPSVRTANVGQTIDWIASASGGVGSYSFQWSGTDGLYGTGATVSRSYNLGGGKFATVIISSGNQTITRSCDSAYISDANYYGYNTYNQNYYNQQPPYYQPYQSYAPLQVTCAPSATSAFLNDTVAWTSSVYGGTGSYQYAWSGTDNLFGSGNSAYRAYSSPGVKTASLTVFSGGQSMVRVCSNSVSVNNVPYYNSSYVAPANQSLQAACFADSDSVRIGTGLSWVAVVSGGNGSYFYSWTGTDGLAGSTRILPKTYAATGRKYGSVIVTSGSETVTRSCTNSVLVSVPVAASAVVSRAPAAPRPIAAQPLDGSCVAAAVSLKTGDSVLWQATSTGGAGTARYVWTGSDGLSGTGESISKSYLSLGGKVAYVTITSGDQSIIRPCLNGVAVEDSRTAQLASSASAFSLNGPFGIFLIILLVVALGVIFGIYKRYKAGGHG